MTPTTPVDRLLTASLIGAPLIYLIADSLYAARGWADVTVFDRSAVDHVADYTAPCTTPSGVAWVLLGGSLMGAAFGFSWAFMARQLLAALSDEEAEALLLAELAGARGDD